MQEIKLIALDLDGTLLSPDKTISQRNIEVLRRAVEQGVAVVVASGRCHESAMHHSTAIEQGQPVISSNGAMACLTAPFECVYCECLSKEQLRRIVSVLSKEKCTYHVYVDDGTIMESRDYERGLGSYESKADGPQRTMLSDDEMPKYVGDGALKVVCFSDDVQKLTRVRTQLEDHGDLEINSSWWNNVEFLAKGVHKGSALTALAERLAIPMEQVMAVGDNENDLSMLDIAGLPIAMGNATEHVKARVKDVTRSNEEDGVAHAVLKWVLGEEA